MSSHDGKLVTLSGPASAYGTEAVSAVNLKAVLNDPKVQRDLQDLLLEHITPAIPSLDLTTLTTRINSIA